MIRPVIKPALAILLGLFVSLPGLADTIKLKDGSVIRGQVIGFRDQQFTVLVGTGSRGRRSQITIYMEDVESIEFDSATGVAPIETASTGAGDSSMGQSNRTSPTVIPPRETSRTDSSIGSTASTSRPPTFFQINTRVRADDTANGWTNTGLVVRRGQRLRLTATGQVSLGAGRTATPAGIPTLADRDKLMRDEPTGALIAVIGDDNDDFIFVGRNREFTAQRDGVLFLGVNEGNLNDNSGAYDVTIEAEVMSTPR